MLSSSVLSFDTTDQVREENKVYKDMPALVKTKTKKRVVPILPFKTNCRPHQYPESKVSNFTKLSSCSYRC